MSRSAAIITYGCQMNEADTFDITGHLRKAGYRRVPNYEDADLVILNTCAIREKAEVKVHGMLGQLHRLRRRRPWLTIGVMGCMAAQSKDALEERADFVIPPVEAFRLPEVLRGVPPPPGMGEEPGDAPPADMGEETPFKRFLTIIRGCDYRCTFCVVPNTRGPEVSIPPEDVFQSVETMRSEGVVEVMLLGQTVNAYSHGDWDFPRLLSGLARQFPDVDFRFLTSHPRNFTPSAIEAMAGHANVLKYLHLPFQAGSERVLRRMKRLYTASEYLSLVDQLRQAMPDLSLSTDIICGFPGETEEDFQQTLDVVRKVRFDSAFTFYYSPRPGTPAMKLPDHLPLSQRKARLARLIDLQKEISHEVNQRHVGQTLRCLVERKSRRSEDVMLGRTGGNKCVLFEGTPDGIGTHQNVRIEKADSYTLYGQLQISDSRSQISD